jgi:hypothetical protein
MTALGILAVIIAWIGDVLSGLEKWLFAPASNWVVLVVIYFLYQNLKGIEAQFRTLGERQQKKAERARAHEATQEPSLMNEDADWTTLDQLAMDIVRLETLISWHANKRPIFRDVPVRDIDVEGGRDVFSDDWGPDISKHYERTFREIRALSPRRTIR